MAADNKQDDPARTQFTQILDDASKLYSDSSKKEDLANFLNPPIKSIKELINQIETQNEKFSSFRKKRQSLFSALAATLGPVEVVGEIVAGGASDMFAPAEGIFGAVVYLINAARDVSAAYDSILELFDQLKVSDIVPNPASQN